MAIFGDKNGGAGVRSTGAYSGRKPHHMEAAGKLSLKAVTIIWAFALVLVGTISFWAYDTSPPMSFIVASIEPDGGNPGDRVTSRFRVNVLRNCTLDVEREWVDAHNNIWPATTAHLNYPKGTYDIVLTSTIPMDAWVGKALLRYVVAYSCNPLQYLYPRRQPMPPLYVTVQR